MVPLPASAPPAVFQTSSVRKTGFAELARFISAATPLSPAAELDREDYFLRKEIRYYFGEYGIRKLGVRLQATAGQGFEQRRHALLTEIDKAVIA